MFVLEGGTIIILAILALYFIPTICVRSGSGRRLSVFVLNLLLGWTLVGWVVALVLALWPVKSSE
jgi:uncharacterized membrane protein YqaE (UPF0057 family)